MPERIYLYDTSLRDGAQTRGVDFSAADKTTVAGWLDELGIDYIEGGWPGANPTDDAFFAAPPQLKYAKLAAFGMTRKSGRSAANDPALQAVLDSPAKTVCLVGKTWDFHVTGALGVTLDENLDLIASSVAHAVSKGKEVLFDAEHFFDGAKANPDYAFTCLQAAHKAGARWIVLCDTNGGSLPHEIEAIVARVAREISGENLAIHVHDDTGNAVANSLAAVRAGCRMIQGTLNGLGERCGNANLVTLIPTLMLKLGYQTGVTKAGLRKLTQTSRQFDALLDRDSNASAPYVGQSAFAHKGGLHASAVAKQPKLYEHVDPEGIGNRREIVMSDQAGRSNVLMRLREMDIKVADDDPRLGKLVALVKQREHEGYSYDHAGASFALLALRLLERMPATFSVVRFSVRDEGHFTADGKMEMHCEASVTVRIGDKTSESKADGNGPVHALDRALRKVLEPHFPALKDIRLTDYRVRIMRSRDATGAMPRVLLETEDTPNGALWHTTGLSTNIIDASLEALCDSFNFKLMQAAQAGAAAAE